MVVKKYSEADLENYLSYLGGTTSPQHEGSIVRRTLRRIPFFDMVYEMKSNFGRCLFDESHQPRYLFHGTTKERLPQIFQNGLDPSQSFLGPLYFAVNFDDAKSWAQSKSLKEKSKPSVIYVDRSELTDLAFERRDESTFRCNNRIQPENIKPVGVILEYFLTQ
jgi:hypothetical protein